VCRWFSVINISQGSVATRSRCSGNWLQVWRKRMLLIDHHLAKLLAKYNGIFSGHGFVSDVAVFVLKRDVKLQLTNSSHGVLCRWAVCRCWYVSGRLQVSMLQRTSQARVGLTEDSRHRVSWDNDAVVVRRCVATDDCHYVCVQVLTWTSTLHEGHQIKYAPPHSLLLISRRAYDDSKPE